VETNLLPTEFRVVFEISTMVALHPARTGVMTDDGLIATVDVRHSKSVS
jgi:hypothetical protein